jgi:hypothetical protein
MPYLLILLGTILISIGIWMLQKPKATRQSVPIETVEHSKSESIQTVDPPKEETQPSNKEKGNDFEKFVVSKFSRNYFSIKQWQGDKFHEGRFAEANQHPDLLMEFHMKDVSTQFAVECKWKSKLTEIHYWAEERQIENYQKFEEETGLPVFVVLGFGGTASQPEEVYVFQLQNLKYAKLKKSYMENFKRPEADKGFFFDLEKKKLL